MNKVNVTINLPDDELLAALLMAHERDITFNQFVEEILVELINRDSSDLAVEIYDDLGSNPYPFTNSVIGLADYDNYGFMPENDCSSVFPYHETKPMVKGPLRGE